MLHELCPRCGAEWLDGARACAVCGFDQFGARAPQGEGVERRWQLRPLEVAMLVLATLAVAIASFGAGFMVRTDMADRAITGLPATTEAAEIVPLAGLGRVLFAETLGDSLDLHSYRTQFTQADTIAWRAEFPEPASQEELTVVIEWYSVRETMRLSETTIVLQDPELTMVASDEIPLVDLVPTAGLYSVVYYSGRTKLAEGIFELLPPDG